MRKLLKVIIGLVILIAIVMLIAPYFIGSKIERTYLTTLSHKVSSAAIKPTIQRYKRGWFTSEVEMTLQFDTLSQTTLKGKVVIYHGPITRIKYPDGKRGWGLNWYTTRGKFKLYDNFLEKLINSNDSIYVYTYHQSNLADRKLNLVRVSPIDLTISNNKTLKISQTNINFEIIKNKGIYGVVKIDDISFKNLKYHTITNAQKSSGKFTIFEDKHKLTAWTYELSIPILRMRVHKLNFLINNLKLNINTDHQSDRKTTKFLLATGNVDLDKHQLGLLKSKAQFQEKNLSNRTPSSGYIFNTKYLTLSTNNGDITGAITVNVPPTTPSDAGKIFSIGEYLLSGKGVLSINIPKHFLEVNAKNEQDYLTSVLLAFYRQGYLISQRDGNYHTYFQFNNNNWSINGKPMDATTATTLTAPTESLAPPASSTETAIPTTPNTAPTEYTAPRNPNAAPSEPASPRTQNSTAP